MRRINWKTVSTLVTMIVIAGCQDNTVTTPTQQSAGAPARLSLAPAGRPQLQLNSSAATSTSSDFTVGPQGGTFLIGRNAVYFPANSICNPATSSYGMGHWNESCTPLRQPIRIHAVTSTVNGRVAVDFSPSLRFVPSNDPSRYVWLYLTLPGNSIDLNRFNILYAPVSGGKVYNEALTDPTVRTYVGAGIGIRRIKHFSGYVSVGGVCEDPEGCYPPGTVPPEGDNP